MTTLDSGLDPSSPAYRANREALLERLAELETALDQARAGGGEKYVTRHHKRGKLLPRERIELLLDQDSPFLELSPVAAYGTDFPVGASTVTGIGVVEGVECLVVANDPTVRGGAVNPWALAKTRRAGEIALANRLPMVNLVESAGADLPTQAEIFIPGGRVFRDLTRLSAAKIPTVSVVFGNATAGGAYVPGMSDYTIMIRDRSQVYLAGPPLVKMATGEVTDDESLGGAVMHSAKSGLADFLAEDERDGIRLARQCVRRLNWRKQGPAPRNPFPSPPKYDPDELLGIASADLKVPFDPREVLARVLDGSDFDEFKPGYGTALVTGWGELHGYPVGVLANARGVLFSEEAQKAAQFIQLANAADTPLVFLQNTTGYMVGTECASYGAGNYGMCGRAYEPRFLFTWPNAKSAVMGPAQLAGVLSIVARQAATARGRDYDEESDAAMRMMVEQQIESQSGALFLSGRLYDDGVIDPRDTRTVLGLCLSAIHNGPVKGADGFGVFRM
ncbi:carboxyl transferase domain-containing protein [Micromonospora halotolerans]